MAHMRGGIRTSSVERRDPRQEPIRRSRTAEWEDEHGDQGRGNVGRRERLISGLIGGGLLLHSIRPPFSAANGLGAIIGIALMHRSLTGYCAAYDVMGLNTQDRTDTSSIGRRKVHSSRALKIEESIVVERSAKDLYRFWRQLSNLPTVMSHVQSVEPRDDRRSHWTIRTLPGGPTIEWDAEIINEVEDERIGWRTLEGATVEHAGSVQFQALDGARTTRVTVTLQYDPPAGPLGAAIAGLFGQEPGRKIADDLEHFKQKMESEAAVSH